MPNATLVRMGIDHRARIRLLTSQSDILSRAQALQIGMTSNQLRHCIRADGPWQILLPGIYLTVTGAPTPRQLEVAAALHAGPGSVITGPAACALHGIRAPDKSAVDVLVPVECRRKSIGFAVLHRTRWMPAEVRAGAAADYALPSRAVADTVLRLRGISDARACVASAVQQNLCTVSQLSAEARHMRGPGATLLRAVLAEVEAGIRSAPEGDFRDLIRVHGLPSPMLNPRLMLAGEFLASPDAWWPGAGVAVEIDSREWHLSPADWQRTLRRHDRMTAAGILVLHFTPREVRAEPARVAREIGAALRAGRPIPAITAVPAAA